MSRFIVKDELTLDKSSFAYKPIDDMVESIVDIIKLS